jgi:hypothetical protein
MTRRTILSMAGAVALMVGLAAGVAAQTATSLGTVNLARGVMADGKALPAGSYTLRVSTAAVTSVVGQAEANAKWVEFVQGGEVKGRELASVVPSAEVAQVVKGTAPASGRAKVELLRGGEYLRVWANQAGTHYLIHLIVN